MATEAPTMPAPTTTRFLLTGGPSTLATLPSQGLRPRTPDFCSEMAEEVP